MNISVEKLIEGNPRVLAKAITLVESTRDEHIEVAQDLLEKALPESGNSLRIGISGTPGVGKSTFIEAFGLHLIKQGHKVAVLAVDPSSPVSGGSIMGDKTRMEQLSKEKNAFIRPSPSSGNLGGVAKKTRETMILCEAAGYDVVLIETVGVGQSEYEVASMVDFFLVLMQPGSGDELQGIKKGIVELVDSIVVNKADGDSINLAKQTQNQYTSALKIIEDHSAWSPKVLTCSALENRGISEVWDTIQEFKEVKTQEGTFDSQRDQQNRDWMEKLVHEMINARIKGSEKIQKVWDKESRSVSKKKTTPFKAASKILKAILKN